MSDLASGYLYFGLQKSGKEWIFREWAPHATAIYIIGTCNGWQKKEEYRLQRIENGVWEIKLPLDKLHHLDLFKLWMEWEGGSGERIPAWIRRVVQDPETKIFSAQVWSPEKPYQFQVKRFKPDAAPLMIYECHIGMAANEEKVGSYNEFREKVLPRIVKDGYNAIQIMAIQEHPYYGSFGYHVSSFFAASSRFGTPDELKQLIDEAHKCGLAVIMDIVHSHAVKNETEGLAALTVHTIYISTVTDAVNTLHGIPSVLTMERMKSCTSSSPIANFGWMNINSTGSGLTVSPPCFIIATA